MVLTTFACKFLLAFVDCNGEFNVSGFVGTESGGSVRIGVSGASVYGFW